MSAAAGVPARAGAVRRGEPGFTLIEVLVAAAIAGLVLAGSYAWLWNVAALAAKSDDRSQAATIASAVSRAAAGDVHDAVGVEAPPPGRDPSRSLALLHDHVDVAPEAVLVVWDSVRGVVWRNASGTYLADHVTRFAVSYGLGGGRRLTGAAMGAADWALVRAVRIELIVTVGRATAVRSVEITVGPA